MKMTVFERIESFATELEREATRLGPDLRAKRIFPKYSTERIH